MDGKYVIMITPEAVEHDYAIVGTNVEHFNVLSTAIWTVLQDFDRVFERIAGKAAESRILIPVFMQSVIMATRRYVEARDGVEDARGFVYNLLKQANGEE